MTQAEASDTAVRYDNGSWFGATLGFFIGLLVDAGQDPAVVFRVVNDGEHDAAGRFTRRIEVILIPNGHVRATLGAVGAERVHKTLAMLIENDLVS